MRKIFKAKFNNYVSRCNRPRQIKKGESTNRASVAILNPYTKTDPGPPPSLFEIKGLVFVNFSLYIRKFLDFSQHAVFTICILFTFSNKNIGYV